MRHVLRHSRLSLAGSPSADPRRLELASTDARQQAGLTTLEDPTETALFAQLVARAVHIVDAKRVLDVGCGAGIPTLAAARAGAEHVVGIDLMACNADLARRHVERAQLQDRVSILHGCWEDVCAGNLDVGAVDLVVANPPYIPSGEGVAVDGGPRGTRIAKSIIRGMPAGAQGLAMMFGSISDPLTLVRMLARNSLNVCEILVQSVPFGRYTSRPSTLQHLKRLRAAKYAWFCNTKASAGMAPYAYLTFGVIAKTSPAYTPQESVYDALADLLTRYQRDGASTVPEGASLLHFT